MITDWARCSSPLPSVTTLIVAGEVDRGDVVGDQLGAEALGLLAQVVHEVRAHDAVGEAGEVLDVGGVHQRATGGHRALEHERREVGARGVDRGGVTGRARADDDHVADVVTTAASRECLGRRSTFLGGRFRERRHGRQPILRGRHPPPTAASGPGTLA